MKKYLVAIILILVLAAVTFGACPAPFEKAKQIALRGTPNEKGLYIVTYNVNKNGEEVIYLIGYSPQYKIVAIGKSAEGAVIYEYDEDSCECTVYVINVMFRMRVPIDREEAIKQAFLIFREMVTEKLL